MNIIIALFLSTFTVTAHTKGNSKQFSFIKKKKF